MSNVSKKMLMAAAGSAGGAGLDVDEVFSTFLIDGNGSTQAINNGLDLSGEGGLVWIKNRDDAGSHHMLYDTVQPLISSKIARLRSSGANDADSGNNELSSFNNNGFTLGGSYNTNSSSYDYVSWTFRNSPMFQVVKYTGTGSTQTISHSLGSVPAVMMVKSLSSGSRWNVYHKDASPNGTPQNGRMALNRSDAWGEHPTVSVFQGLWNNTAPTDSVFTVGSYNDTNANGETFVAYLFAHHANDGSATGFGPDGDSPVISCGSAPASAATDINLGFEPQWIMIKRTDSSGDWQIFDTMRGLVVDSSDNQKLEANTSDAEEGSSSTYLYPKPNGFHINTNYFGGGPYIFISIRRGSLNTPDDATKVFAIDTAHSDNNNTVSGDMFTAGFPVDMGIFSKRSSTSFPNIISARLTQGASLYTNATDAENTSTDFSFDHQTGWSSGSTTITTDKISWMWKRAPSYFDVCAWTGTGSNRTIAHNLGAVPEMMWIKGRNQTASWIVGGSAIGNGTTNFLILNSTSAMSANTSYFNNTAQTSSVLNIGASAATNNSGSNYIAYLFATVAGVSKVGSFTLGSSGSSNIDCGFSSGARFILAKKTSGTGGWLVWDTTRGIVAGADKFLNLNNTDAETDAGGYDFVDPYSQGFTIPEAAYWGAGSYIFYAIA